MYLVSGNTKIARFVVLIMTIFSLGFIVIILEMINPSTLIWISIFLFFLLLFAFLLRFYFFDWDVYVGENKIELKNLFRTYTYENLNLYSVKHAGFFSIIYSIYRIQIGQKNFWFFYKKKSFFSINPNSITNEILREINKGSK